MRTGRAQAFRVRSPNTERIAGEADQRPWLRLRRTAHWHGDPFAPVLDDTEIKALK